MQPSDPLPLIQARPEQHAQVAHAIRIAEAIRAGHDARWSALFAGTELSATERRQAAKYLQDPLWRPLCEIAANDFTDYASALLLLGAGLVGARSFRVRVGPAAGRTVDYIQLTTLGAQQLEAYRGPGRRNSLSDKLIASIQDYAAIDHGFGLIPTRNGAEAAIERDDWALLRRFRSLMGEHYPLQQIGDDNLLDEDDRIDYLDGLAEWDGDRTGGALIVLEPAM